jgi:bacteriorhodopsin
MGDLVAFFVGLVTDNLGHAGQRWAWWILGAVGVLIVVLCVVISGNWSLPPLHSSLHPPRSSLPA